MALKPEFIGLLRDIRDTKYPEISAWHISIEEMNISIEAIYSAMNEITVGTVTTIENLPDDTHGVATASYDAVTSVLNFGLPAGDKGEIGDTGATGSTGLTGATGDAFEIDESGLFSGRSTYDAEAKGFSYLALDESILYMKLSSTSGDWNTGTPFLQGEQGIQGEQGASPYANKLLNPIRNINQRGYTDSFENLAIGEYYRDMWYKKDSDTIAQILPEFSYLPNETYVLSVATEYGVILDEATTLLNSPSTIASLIVAWEILVPITSFGMGWTIQLERGITPSTHTTKSDLEYLLECQQYYVDNNTPITAMMVDSAMLVKRANISFPVQMKSIPTVTLKASTNGLVAQNASVDGARLSATTSSEGLRAQCDGYIASIQ